MIDYIHILLGAGVYALILISGIMLRLLFARTSGLNTDEWVSLWHIKRQKGSKWITTKANDSIIPGSIGYPVLMHWLVSRFKKKNWMKWGIWLNVAFDILTGIAALPFISYALKSGGKLEEPALNLTISGLTSALFIFCPLLFPLGSRLRTIKGRSLGMFAFFIYLLINVLYLEKVIGIFILSISGFIISVMIVLSSQFALQATIFVTLSLLFAGQPISFILFSISVLIAYFTPRLEVNNIINWYLNHKIWYFKNAKKSTTASNKNKLKDLFITKNHANPINLLKWIQVNNSYLSSVVYFPVLVYVFVVVLLNGFGFGESSNVLKDYFLYAGMGGAGAFIITSIKPFRFLGQPERYFEICSPIYVILLAFYLPELKTVTISVIIILLFYQLTLIIANIFIVFDENGVSGPDSPETSIQKIDEKINNLFTTPKIAAIPSKISFLLSYKTNKNDIKFYYRIINKNDRTGMNYRDVDMGGDWGSKKPHFDVFKLTPDEIRNKYGITHLVVKKGFHESLPELKRELSQYRILYFDENFLLFDINN